MVVLLLASDTQSVLWISGWPFITITVNCGLWTGVSIFMPDFDCCQWNAASWPGLERIPHVRPMLLADRLLSRIAAPQGLEAVSFCFLQSPPNVVQCL